MRSEPLPADDGEPTPESAPPEAERTEQAARLAAMLTRWATEDVSQEPDWDVGEVERVRFSGQPKAASGTLGS
jgi:hypothetical protein